MKSYEIGASQTARSIVIVLIVFLLGMVLMGFLMQTEKPYEVNTPTNLTTHQYYFYNYTTNENEIYNITNTEKNVYFERFEGFPLRKHRNCKLNAKRWRVHGQSMHPLVSDGYVWVDSVRWRDVEVGDAVVIELNGSEETSLFHALIYKNDEYALSKGYNNEYVDDFDVEPSMITKRYCVKK